LAEVQNECSKLGVQFHLLEGSAPSVLPNFIKAHEMGALVTDFSPLRTHMDWINEIKESLPSNVPLCQASRNINLCMLLQWL
jgi:deoxyribodipyrimidine photo-lyase